MNYSGSIGALAGKRASEAVWKAVMAECKRDKEGNMYTTAPDIFSRFTRGMVIAMAVLDISLLFFLIGAEPEDVPCIIGLVIATIFICPFFVFAMKKRFSSKYILEADGLKISTPNFKEVIPYEDIRKWMEEVPPVAYGFSYIFVVNKKVISMDISSLVGGIDFVDALCERVGVEGPAMNETSKEAKYRAYASTKEKKKAYKALMRRVKEQNWE